MLYPQNLKFWGYYGFGLDTNARIKFIFETAIDDLEWKNPIDFGENREKKMAANGHFVKI